MRSLYITLIDLAINKFMTVTEVPAEYIPMALVFKGTYPNGHDTIKNKLLDIFRSWQQEAGIAIPVGLELPVLTPAKGQDIGKAQGYIAASQLYAQHHQVIS